jgi:hypothetical protein
MAGGVDSDGAATAAQFAIVDVPADDTCRPRTGGAIAQTGGLGPARPQRNVIGAVIAPGDGAVIALDEDGKVWRINPASPTANAEVVGTVGAPRGIVVSAGRVLIVQTRVVSELNQQIETVFSGACGGNDLAGTVEVRGDTLLVGVVGGFGVIRPRDGFCTFVNEQGELSSAATWLPSGRIVSWDQQNIRLYDPATLSECPDCALENLQPGNGVGPGAFAPLGEGVVLFGAGLLGTFVVEDPNGSSPLSVSSDETWDNARAALRVP